MSVCIGGDEEELITECNSVVHGESPMLACEATSAEMEGENCSPQVAVECEEPLDNRLDCEVG
jgi:hypothetical protein